MSKYFDIKSVAVPVPQLDRWLGSRCAVLIAVLLCGPVCAQESTPFFEDFDDLVLGPFVSPGQGTGSGSDWTDVPPPGWVRDNSTTPVGGPAEFFGWTFLDKNSWVMTEGDQQRGNFIGGVGTVMVADPDAYDDAPPGIQPNLFRAFMTTPAISLQTNDADSTTLQFDSSWRPDVTQTATIDVSFDGGQWEEALRWESVPESPNFKPDAVDELVTVELDIPQGAVEVQIRFGLIDAGNNWWWAIDNVSVQGIDDRIFSDNFENVVMRSESEF